MIDMETESAGSAPVLSPATVMGTSGQVYRATDLLKVTTRQKNAARDCVAAVLPSVLITLQAVQESLVTSSDGTIQLDNSVVQQMIRSLDIEAVFNALVMDDADLKLLAILYLPEGEAYHADSVDARADDLMDLSYGEKFEAFKGFFSLNGAISPTTTHGFLQSVMTPTKTTNPDRPKSSRGHTSSSPTAATS